MADDFDRGIRRTTEYAVYGSFMTGTGGYMFALLDTAAKLNPETTAGKCFVDTASTVILVGTTVSIAGAAYRAVRKLKSNSPAP